MCDDPIHFISDTVLLYILVPWSLHPRGFAVALITVPHESVRQRDGAHCRHGHRQTKTGLALTKPRTGWSVGPPSCCDCAAPPFRGSARVFALQRPRQRQRFYFSAMIRLRHRTLDPAVNSTRLRSSDLRAVRGRLSIRAGLQRLYPGCAAAASHAVIHAEPEAMPMRYSVLFRSSLVELFRYGQPQCELSACLPLQLRCHRISLFNEDSSVLSTTRREAVPHSQPYQVAALDFHRVLHIAASPEACMHRTTARNTILGSGRRQ